MKADNMYYVVQKLLANGAPLHGVGFQFHNKPPYLVTADDLIANIKRFNDLGLKSQFSEIDM